MNSVIQVAISTWETPILKMLSPRILWTADQDDIMQIQKLHILYK